jgi:hypothetical protein
MASYNSDKLTALLVRLMPNEPALVPAFQAICQRFDQALQTYDPETMEAPDNPQWNPQFSPWLNLVSALQQRRLLIAFDWRTAPEDVQWSFTTLTDHPAVGPDFWHWFQPDDWRTSYTSELLQAVARQLRQLGLTLVHLDTASDSYPVMIVPLTEAEALEQLAQTTGYGQIHIW